MQPITPIKAENSHSDKKRSQSERRLIKLEKIGFQLQAQKLRKEYSNKNILHEMKMKSKSTKKILTQIPEQRIGNFLKPTKIISVTAHKWVIYDYFSSKYIRGYRARDSHQLSCFSKLLVFCAVNTLVQKFKLDMNRFETIVSQGVLKLHKNQCLLKVDDIVSLQDLLSLMIMEESEVYETILAVNMGAFLEKKRRKQYYSVFDAHDKYMKDHLKQFYDLVNSYCKLLKLQTIRYVESQPQFKKQKNKGSAADIAVLSSQCCKIPLFMNILKQIQHNVQVKFINTEGHLQQKHIVIRNKAILNKYIHYSSVCRNWEQHNFMSSHCSIYYQHKQSQKRPIIIILLGCYGPQDREKDIQQIVQWYIKTENKDQLLEVPQNKNQQIEIPISDKKHSLIEQINKKSSVTKLGPLKGYHFKTISREMDKKIEKKLKTEHSKQVTNRYDKGIPTKSNNQKAFRLKTNV